MFPIGPMVGMMLLKSIYNLSDEGVVTRRRYTAFMSLRQSASRRGNVCYLKTKTNMPSLSDSHDGYKIGVGQAELCNLWE